MASPAQLATPPSLLLAASVAILRSCMRCLFSKQIAPAIKLSTSKRVLLALLGFIVVVFVCGVCLGLMLCLGHKDWMFAVAIATMTVRGYALLYVMLLVDVLCRKVLARRGSGICSMASRSCVVVRNKFWCHEKSRGVV
jgi:hypothetical protein